MTLSWKEVLAAVPGINKIGNSGELDIDVAYRVSRLTKALSGELETFEEHRKALRKACLKADETVDEEKWKEGWDKLVQEQVELPDVRVTLKEIAKAGVSPMELGGLDFIIKQEDTHGRPELAQGDRGAKPR